MERRVMGRTGMEVSVLGFGGSEIGFNEVTPEEASRLLNSALDAGLNVIDTGECYRNSEELIGQAVSHRRGDYFLFTKVGHAAGLDGADWEPRMMEESIERSLRRLRTDHLDLLQLHTCSEEMLRAGDVIEVIQRARQAGKTRFTGYSGDHRAARYAVECGAFDTLQTSCNIADQECIELTLPLARERRMGVIAKRPIANVAWKNPDAPESEYRRAYWERLRKLDYPFLGEDLNQAVGYALRFTLSVPGVHVAIVGTSHPDRWRENARLLEAGALTPAEYEAIRTRWREAAGPDWIGQG